MVCLAGCATVGFVIARQTFGFLRQRLRNSRRWVFPDDEMI
jgi:hypothetical protein